MTAQLTQRLVAVDIGNSHLSVMVFCRDEKGSLSAERDSSLALKHEEVPGPCWEQFVADWSGDGELHWFLSSVHRPQEALLVAWLNQHRPGDVVVVLAYDHLPLCLDVDHPEQVGMDRLLAGVAVNQLRREGIPAIVVDCGSAITCDVISPTGVFLGGAILPGWHLAAGVLANQTDQLPYIEQPVSSGDVIGKSTQAAISSGIYWGSLGALKELVSRMSATFSEAPQKFLTGSGVLWRQECLQEGFQEVNDLVLTGTALAGAYWLSRRCSSQDD